MKTEKHSAQFFTATFGTTLILMLIVFGIIFVYEKVSKDLESSFMDKPKKRKGQHVKTGHVTLLK